MDLQLPFEIFGCSAVAQNIKMSYSVTRMMVIHATKGGKFLLNIGDSVIYFIFKIYHTKLVRSPTTITTPSFSFIEML